MAKLLRIEAPHFVAGIMVSGGKVIEAAPILRWMFGKGEEYVKAYCLRKKYKCEEVARDSVGD